MSLRNTQERWGSLAMAFHWAIVILILTQFVLANMAESLPLGMAKLATLARHKSVGITILGLAALRLGWRISNRGHNPPLPADLKGYERFLAHLTHEGLYLLLFAMPLTGWMMSSAANYPVTFFGWFRFPALVGANKELHEVYEEVHEFLFSALLVITVVHVLAALYHHFIQKDDTLRRMLPFGRRRAA